MATTTNYAWETQTIPISLRTAQLLSARSAPLSIQQQRHLTHQQHLVTLNIVHLLQIQIHVYPLVQMVRCYQSLAVFLLGQQQQIKLL